LQAQQTYLKTLFDGGYQYHLKVQPCTHLRVTRGDRWILKSEDSYLKSYDQKKLLEKGKAGRTFDRKQQIVRSNAASEELRWVVARDKFSMGSNFIMVFMKHCPTSWKKGKRKPGKRDLMAWQPMKSRPDVDNFCKKIFDSLLQEDKEVWCVGLLKIWIPDEVEEGTYFIYVPELFQFVVSYLSKKLTQS
jgi:Holliday junction resolvase RusA-like endonuclease